MRQSFHCFAFGERTMDPSSQARHLDHPRGRRPNWGLGLVKVANKMRCSQASRNGGSASWTWSQMSLTCFWALLPKPPPRLTWKQNRHKLTEQSSSLAGRGRRCYSGCSQATAKWLWLSKPMVLFLTHFRTYFSGDWDVHWEYGPLTHGQVGQAVRQAR